MIWCWLFGHRLTYDRAQDGTKVWRCWRCDKVKVRDTRDVRPLEPNWPAQYRLERPARLRVVK